MQKYKVILYFRLVTQDPSVQFRVTKVASIALASGLGQEVSKWTKLYE